MLAVNGGHKQWSRPKWEDGGKMAGIEDYVVEQIIQDFQQSPMAPQAPQIQASQVGNRQPQQYGYPGWENDSSFMQEAKYAGQVRNSPIPPGAVEDPRQPNGYRFDDRNALNKYAEHNARLASGAASGQMMDRAYRERDQNRFKIMEGLKGLDPQIQGTILKRLGIDPGPIKSAIDQQKEVLKYKQELEAPQNEMANAIKMMLATQGGQQNAAELQMKQQAHAAEQASRGQTQNIQLMRVLASLMQSDATGQLSKQLGPLLMQMLQGSGINLAPQQPQGASAGCRAGIKITRE